MSNPNPVREQPMRRFRESTLYNWLGERAKRFVRSWRRFDTYANQPMPVGRKWCWTWLAPDGCAWFAAVLVTPPIARCLAGRLASGPTVATDGWRRPTRMAPRRPLRPSAERPPGKGNQRDGRHARSQIQRTMACSSPAVDRSNHHNKRAATDLWRDGQWR